MTRLQTSNKDYLTSKMVYSRVLVQQALGKKMETRKLRKFGRLGP